MDLIKLDEQIEKNLERFNRILDESEDKLKEASDLKEYFENQTVGLRDAYKKRLNQFETGYKEEREAFSKGIKEFDEYYTKLVALFEKLDAEKKEFDLLANQFDKLLDKKWKDFNKENKKTISSLEHNLNSRVDALKELHKNDIEEIASINLKNVDALSNFEEQLNRRIKHYDNQIAKIINGKTHLAEKLEKAKEYSEAIDRKLDEDYGMLSRQLKNTGNIVIISFSICALLLVYILLRWVF